MMCSCVGNKRGKRMVKRYKKNEIVPEEPKLKNKKVDSSFMEEFLRESMYCGNCREVFTLSSNELKIHCNICNEFFHCGIAGQCIGEDCLIKDEDGNPKHRASYCNRCVAEIYNKETCLCKTCGTR
jgi:hypothetical protein